MIQFKVYGEPAPQGSKRHVGRGIMVESSLKVKPWREAVKWAAIEAATVSNDGISVMLLGPLSVSIVFTLSKPKSSPKSRLYPDRKPDLDKLVRSTLDALTQAGVFADDSQVVEIGARKSFPGEHALSLQSPGAHISIQQL